MHSVVKRWTWPVLVGLVLGCSKPTTTTTTLPAPEAFNFAAQPIVFSPPPAGWEPEPELSGGIRGTRYVKRNSVGEAITIGNYHDVSNRLRQTETAALLAVNSDYASREFDHALRAAWPATENPYSDLESEVAAKVNAALSRAAQARKQRDYETMRRELLSAQEQAGRLHFRFEDVIERALFRPENTSDPSRYKFVGKRDIRIAGQPAVVVDYTLETREGRRYLRRAYVMYNDHMFVAQFIGLEASLPLFDQVVASIAFPA